MAFERFQMVEKTMNPYTDESVEEANNKYTIHSQQENKFDISLFSCQEEKPKKMDIGQLLEQGSKFAKEAQRPKTQSNAFASPPSGVSGIKMLGATFTSSSKRSGDYWSSQ